MSVQIRPFTPADLDAVVALSLHAWAPVFASFQDVLGSKIYERVYPDWLTSQARAVQEVCTATSGTVHVAVADGHPVGFVAVVIQPATDVTPCTGDIEMLAVDPAHQRRGIADTLITVALDEMRAAGADLASVMTGGDPGHAPARATYENAGFTALPLVRYYRTL